MRLFSHCAALGLVFALPAQADEIFIDDVIVTQNICAGSGLCTNGEAFGTTDIKIKSTTPEMQFQDTTSGDPTWTLTVDDGISGAFNGFSIKNEATSNYPFAIDEDAPHQALFLSDSGRIGLGTRFPQLNVHMADSTYGEAGIRLEETVGTPYIWDLRGNDSGFYLYDASALTLPFQVRSGAPSSSLEIESNGWVGIGTGSASAPFELSGPESYNFFRITATGAAVNESVDITFTGGPLGTGQLRYNIVDGDAQEMSLDADGNMILGGTLTTGGPTCAGGCDAVFTDQQIIPAQEYAAQMWANGHLPHVGPTAPGEAFNVTEKVGGILNALEHAHIYIEDLHQQNAALAAQVAALNARLEALERKD